MRIRNVHVFLSFFSVLSQIVIVIRGFVGGSPFPCGIWQGWQDPLAPSQKKHVGVHPHTIMN